MDTTISILYTSSSGNNYFLKIGKYSYSKNTYNIIEYDILISHISEFTTESNISKNGKLFILSNDFKVIGLPNEEYITGIDSIRKYILQDYDSVYSSALEISVKKWLTLSENYSEPFTIKVDGKKWWARITKYELGENNHFIIGVVVPEKDFLAEIHKSRNIVFGGFMIILIFVIIVVAVADCTGHGVPGAFMSMLGISFLNEIVIKEDVIKPSEILTELRDFVKYSLKQTGKNSESKDGMDIVIYTINTEDNSLEFSGAYNPLYVREKNFTNHKFQLQKNDCLYTFSDGFMYQFGGENNEKFMIRKFKALITSIAHNPIAEQKKY